MLYFKVLPTDDRFQQLSDEQKQFLFYGYLNQPDPTRIRDAYQSKVTSLITEDEKKNLKEVCGYSDDQIKYFEDEIRKANNG